MLYAWYVIRWCFVIAGMLFVALFAYGAWLNHTNPERTHEQAGRIILNGFVFGTVTDCTPIPKTTSYTIVAKSSEHNHHVTMYSEHLVVIGSTVCIGEFEGTIDAQKMNVYIPGILPPSR